jgi:excisionase family DNA binding protein
METVIEKITKKDQELAKSSVSKIRKAAIAVKHSGNAKIKIQEHHEFLDIPEKAFHLLVEILVNMSEGKSIALIPSETEISTQQAADMLNVSRPHIVKLLEGEIIPFKKVGTHRRIELRHLLEYEKKLKRNRQQNLDFLAEQAQELKLGY